TFGLSDADGTLQLSLEYSTDLYEADTVRRMASHYVQLLSHALDAPATPLGQLQLLDEAERRQLLEGFNATSAPMDAEATVVSLFDRQVAATPEAPALVTQGETLTFAGLQARARKLAGQLAALGAGPERIVGLCLERTADLIVSQLAILYSGAAYLPLEPKHPAARRAELLERAGAELLVSRSALFEGAQPGCRMVAPDEDGPSAPLARPSAGNLAYVIYTSGSTGEPKGVEVSHRNLVHAFGSFDRDYVTGPGNRWLAQMSVSFDIHVVETVYALSRGSTVVLRAPGVDGMVEDLARHGITHAQVPAVYHPALLEDPAAEGVFRELSVVIFGGTSPGPEAVRRLSPRKGRMLNCYGPTETTIGACAHRLRPGEPIRIGGPAERTRFYVLDPQGAPAPTGVPGELYIGGEGVSRGYRSRPDLTAERFVPDPFSGVPGARLYRTGDRVKWHADGSLAFLGRADFQVKVRGVRIELEEVEAALLRVPGVRQAAVLAQTRRSDTRLIGFIALEPGASTGEVEAAISARLPEVMVPSRFVVLEELPHTTNGKPDRKALAAMPLDEEAARAGEPPRTPEEELVARSIAQLLGLERVGRDENFFVLGGNSLSASQLASRLRRVFGAELPLTAVFSSPTVADLAAALARAPRLEGSARLLAPREKPARIPASLVQERLWYALQLPQAPPFIIITGLHLEGELSVPRLERALSAVLERHETLRSTFYVEDNTVYVRTHPPAPVRLEVQDLSHLPEDGALRSALELLSRRGHEHLDLARGPLYRFELLRLDGAGRGHVLCASISHLVTDGIGMQVFFDELATAWREAKDPGATALLPPPEVQYADFALAQREPGYEQRLERSLEAWKAALAGVPPSIDLPVDGPRRAQPLNANMRDVRLSLRGEDGRAFKALAREEGVTTFAAALALMQAWLHRLSGDARIAVAANISGRVLPDTERMVGFFTNLVPLGMDLSGKPSFRALLGQAQKAVEHASAHQEVPFKRIVDAVHPSADAAVLPLAQTLLIVNGAGRMGLDGLSVSSLENENVIPAYELILTLAEGEEDRLEATVSYDSALFTSATAERFAAALGQLLGAAARQPDAPISRLSILSPAQREGALAQLSGPKEPVEAGTCVHTLFERQVARTPEAPAVAQVDGGAWSYAELNARANRVAAELLAEGLLPEERVGVVMEPSRQAMAVLLGILKAGGAYVPLDATWPEPRKQTILGRAGVRRLLVDASQLRAHAHLAERVRVPEEPAEVPRDLGPGPRGVHDTQLAYIVFTSGSTGEPKGVMVQHRSVVNHNLAIAARFGLGPGDRMLQFAPLSFDAAAEDLYPPLAVGATVVMKNGLMPAHSLSPWLERERISVISLPPTYIEEWVREMQAQGQQVPRVLKLLAPGGDVLKRETYEAWVRQGGGHAPWVNVYGPTECTITS
ncbi:MAG TPA: amino acid adenylation domain-containing protein, partial [Longimicrobium sp.]|nr:amino acid adenylation domain-containing protein [Longimicrobium sp.]